MSFFQNFKTGITSYGRALRFISENKLAVYFLFPILINILLFFGGIALITTLTDWIEQIIFSQIDEWIGNLSWLSWVKSFLHILIWLIFKIVYFFLFAFIGGFIVLIIMSPLLAFLSEKTEKIVTGKDYPLNVDQLVRDILRGVIMALRNMFIQLFFTVIIFIIGFIPVINIISPFALFVVSSYFYGFSFLDYSNERKKLSISESAKYVKKHSGLAISNGTVFSIFLIIPGIGVSLSGFVAIISVVAATLSVIETDKN